MSKHSCFGDVVNVTDSIASSADSGRVRQTELAGAPQTSTSLGNIARRLSPPTPPVVDFIPKLC